MMQTRSGLYYDAERREMARRDKEMIPRKLIVAMGVLALVSLSLTTFAVVTDRQHVGVPKAAAVVAERQIVLAGDGQGATVRTLGGAVLMDSDEGGFVAAVRQALDRERVTHRVEGNPPVTLAALEGGRITIHDPATGWRAELASFGVDNRVAWLPLLEGAGN